MGWFLTSRRALTIILVKICSLSYAAAVADGVVILVGHRASKSVILSVFIILVEAT
jgi:hypothetical protein